MITKIAKDFYWEMSHRLPFHKGPCKNIHGHSYKIRVEISGEPDNNGIVIDDLKLVMLPLIEQLDHSFVVDKNDTLMINFLKENNMKYYILNKTTTAENLAEYIFTEIKNQLKSKFKNISHLTIRLFETDDVYAEVDGSINN